MTTTVGRAGGAGQQPANPAWRLPPHIVQALAEGRFRPGRGPWYCGGILPPEIPVRRQVAISSGLTRWAVETGYDTLAYGVVVEALAEGNAGGGVGDRRDLGGYPRCICQRARAQLMNHPDCVLGGWGAARYHGLTYWADSAPVLLLSDDIPSRGSDRTSVATKHPLRAAVRALPSGFDQERDTVCPDPAFPGLRVVSAPIALAQCVRSVLSGKHVWHVVNIPGLTPRQARAVQLIDAFAMCTYVTWNQFAAAATGIVAKAELKRLQKLVAFGAESPRETELRLFVRDMLPTGHRWETQVEVQLGSTPEDGRTFFDIGCRTLRIGLYYDGAHHDVESQTEKDFEQIQDLQDRRWTVIRVNRKLMRNPRKMLAQIRNAIDRALGELNG